MDRTIGVRDAKARLSEILRDVGRGGRWTITDRGRPVAVLVPPTLATLTLPDRIRRLEEHGLIEPLDHEPEPLPPPLPLERGLASRWLREDRESGR